MTDFMEIKIDKKMAFHLLRGTTPPYELMEELTAAGYGHYVGGFVDDWKWHSSVEGKELEDIVSYYNQIRDYWRKDK